MQYPVFHIQEESSRFTWQWAWHYECYRPSTSCHLTEERTDSMAGLQMPACDVETAVSRHSVNYDGLNFRTRPQQCLQRKSNYYIVFFHNILTPIHLDNLIASKALRDMHVHTHGRDISEAQNHIITRSIHTTAS